MNESTSGHAPPHVIYVFDGYRLEPARRSLTRLDGTELHVTGKPFDALVYLVQHAGEVVDRCVLLQTVWPRRVVEDNNVNQAIGLLRRALGAQHIATVAGRGYQFVTPVQEVAPQRPALLEAPSAGAKPSHGGATASGNDSRPRTVATQPDMAATPPPRAAAEPRPFAPSWMAAAALVIALPATLLLDTWPEREMEAALGAIVSVTPITTDPGEELTPSISPDGTQVAFAWNGGGGRDDIYIKQISTGARIRLTTSTEGADRYPAWSPDGQYIAFLRQLDAARFKVIVVPSIGGGLEQEIYSGDLYWISREGFPLLAWTPDCRQLWFTTRRSGSSDDIGYGLHRLQLDTGDAVPVELGGGVDDYDTSPAISPDGNWLAFVRYRSGERLNQVMVQRLGADFVPTGEAQIVAEAALHHSLAWAPDSARLWFAEGGQILEWHVGGTTRVAATASFSLSAVSFAHSGGAARAAAISRRVDTDIFALPLDPITRAAVAPPETRARSTAVDYHPRFSPDGKQLAFVSDRSGQRALWIAAADGSGARQLTDLEELITGFPRWSPDGARLAFHTSAANESRVIYTIAAEGGAPKRLVNACCPGGWAADGQHVYVHDTDVINRILRVNVSDGAAETLFEGELAVESADRQFLLYAKSRERGYFRRALRGMPGSNEEERLVDDYTPAIGGLAPVADGFFYLGLAADDRPRAFRFYDYALGEARDVWPAPASVAIGLTVSPDGRELLYAAEAGERNADIMLLEFTAP